VISVDDDQRVRLVTFRRPEERNAFDNAMYSAVAEALDEAGQRDDLAVVVLTGEGTAYCAGQDLAEMGRLGHRDERDATVQADLTHHGFSDFFGSIEAFPKPIIAAVNGMAIGLGTTMLPYCDIVLASEKARFRLPFARLGVVPEAGSTFTLPRMMGAQAAAHAFYTSEWIDADAALRCGLVFRLCPAATLVDEALELATAIARMPIVSLVETKQLLLATRLDEARAARWREEAVFARILAGPANREAIAAFLEKREPDFTDLPAE
jgi:enoyl-CoA hydratase/carnithine racemase